MYDDHVDDDDVDADKKVSNVRIWTPKATLNAVVFVANTSRSQ